MSFGLTHGEATALQYIEQRAELGRVAPTLNQIAAKMGVRSKSNAYRVLVSLERKGHIRRLRYSQRAIELIKHNTCPNCGFHLSQDGSGRGVRHGGNTQ